MATAMPRRLANQNDTSAISGPNVAGGAEPDQRRGKRKRPQARRHRSGGVADRHGSDAERHDGEDAAAVLQPPHRDAAQRKAEHGQRERQRRVAARDGELGLDGGSTTGIDHIPTPPTVPSATAAASRAQA